jgi:hypothetical protein
MKILRLAAENVKRLKAVDITPDATLQQITGKNESGKTSVLDSIWWALGGKDAIQDKPIRTGEETATIRLDLGEIIVKRTLERAGEGFKTKLLVLNPIGAPEGTPDKKLPEWKSPQDFLDAILGELTFDPLKFANAKPREQFDQLRKISKLSIDIDGLKDANAADFKARTDINRDAKNKRAQAEAIVVPPDTPVEAVNESAILDVIQSATEHNSGIEKRKLNRANASKEAEWLRAEAARLRGQFDTVNQRCADKVAELNRQIKEAEKDRDDEIVRLENEALAAVGKAEALESKITSAKPLPDPISVADHRLKLNAAKATNAAVEKRRHRESIEKEAVAFEASAQALTETMAGRERQIVDAIKKAEMPIADLGFGDGYVTYKGLPFDQASSAARLRVSTSIAMAQNPKVRVVRIQDGSLLDEDGMTLLAEMAREKDFQVWVERVDSSGKIGVYMEDGEVKNGE